MTSFQVAVVVLLAGIFLLALISQLRRTKRPKREHRNVLQVGVPGLRGDEFIATKVVEDSSETYRLELPGGVSQVGKSYRSSIIPVGVVGISGDENVKSRFALLHFSEEDIEETNKALSIFTQFAQHVPVQFSILTEADDVSYEEIIRGAEEEKFGGDSPIAVKMKVSMRFEGHSTVVVSSPFKGWMVALATTDPGGHSDYSEGSYFSNCHAHWYSTAGFNRYTLCHGPCTAGTCLTWWNRKEWEDGWNTCSC